jgi:hypothetical protein
VTASSAAAARFPRGLRSGAPSSRVFGRPPAGLRSGRRCSGVAGRSHSYPSRSAYVAPDGKGLRGSAVGLPCFQQTRDIRVAGRVPPDEQTHPITKTAPPYHADQLGHGLVESARGCGSPFVPASAVALPDEIRSVQLDARGLSGDIGGRAGVRNVTTSDRVPSADQELEAAAVSARVSPRALMLMDADRARKPLRWRVPNRGESASDDDKERSAAT